MPHSRLAADLSAAACPCRSAILLRRRLLLIHELARILVALGPDAFAHGLAAKLGALPDCAFPGIVSDRFVGSHSFLLPILSETNRGGRIGFQKGRTVPAHGVGRATRR